MRHMLLAFLIVGIFMVPWISFTFPTFSAHLAHYVIDKGNQLAAVILRYDPVTVSELKTDYTNSVIPGHKKVKILLVPGHEPDYGGAEYGSIKERKLTVDVADRLAELLRNDARFDVVVARDTVQWNPLFKTYFDTQQNSIQEWQNAHKTEIARLIRLGQFTPRADELFHNDVPQPVAMRLYGISKWANENAVDIVIHLHFNDYPRKDDQVPGDYKGFAIYVPERQYYNSTTTKAVAESVFDALNKYSPSSDLFGEKEGIIEDQELIAVGAFNTVDAASMLIEYGYIYEPQITNSRVRELFFKDIAYETYLGLIHFLDSAQSVSGTNAYSTSIIPYKWTHTLTADSNYPEDVFALQTALIIHGDYPPEGQTLGDCPRTGKLGPCTKKALKAFQFGYGITEDAGVLVGRKTMDKLNELYSTGN